ncbi:unnamed protein product [Dibothriocephalus latus]|uniref:Uncharacterized protein n=1 Tax=Dibothriocephalus latus TaxID=60516 RepID=A0A3P7L847_DIBLA|nr:unnamed protein product [Dibothriocephalus latus]
MRKDTPLRVQAVLKVLLQAHIQMPDEMSESAPANAAYEQLMMSQQLREQSNAPPEDCVMMDTCIPLIPTNANVKVELPSSAQKKGKPLGPLLIKFQPRPDYLLSQPDSRTYTALKFIQEPVPVTRAEADATTANQESSFV